MEDSVDDKREGKMGHLLRPMWGQTGGKNRSLRVSGNSPPTLCSKIPSQLVRRRPLKSGEKEVERILIDLK